jgi:hypothetical protein
MHFHFLFWGDYFSLYIYSGNTRGSIQTYLHRTQIRTLMPLATHANVDTLAARPQFEENKLDGR